MERSKMPTQLKKFKKTRNCHQCKTGKPPDSLTHCTNGTIHASGYPHRRRCRKAYCHRCITRHYDAAFPEHPASWICFACRQKCNCAKCRNARKRKTMPRIEAYKTYTHAPPASYQPVPSRSPMSETLAKNIYSASSLYQTLQQADVMLNRYILCRAEAVAALNGTPPAAVPHAPGSIPSQSTTGYYKPATNYLRSHPAATTVTAPSPVTSTSALSPADVYRRAVYRRTQAVDASSPAAAPTAATGTTSVASMPHASTLTPSTTSTSTLATSPGTFSPLTTATNTSTMAAPATPAAPITAAATAASTLNAMKMPSSTLDTLASTVSSQSF